MKLSAVTFTKGYQLQKSAGHQSVYIARASDGYTIEKVSDGVIVSHENMPCPRWVASNQCEGGDVAVEAPAAKSGNR